MKIVEKFKAKSEDRLEAGVTIGFLGDSVTQGCFELYRKAPDRLATVFDKNSVYHNCIYKIFSVLYPDVPVNIINGGVSGTGAGNGLKRLERDVLSHNPDLVVVCFGLNDCRNGIEGIEDYQNALGEIFKKISDAGKEVIFMTPNMLNTGISPHITDDMVLDNAKEFMEIQNSGVVDKYMQAAKQACDKHNVRVCDCYSKWKLLYNSGVDVTELLSNKVNHPVREMHWLFAGMLVDTMLN